MPGSTSFPTAIDSFANPNSAGGDTLASVPHDAQHGSANLAIEALETKVGVNGSTDPTSLDYKVANRLVVGANLSDVASAATARTNLGVAPGTGLSQSGGDLNVLVDGATLDAGGAGGSLELKAIGAHSLLGNSGGSSAVPSAQTSPTVSGLITAEGFSASGFTGATSGARFVGATAVGSPATGTFSNGDFVVDQSGSLWICTSPGSPGKWSQVGGINAQMNHKALYPYLFNYTGTNLPNLATQLARVKAGTGSVKIAFVGDSTTAGFGADTSSSYVHAQANSPVMQTKRRLKSMGYNATLAGFLGTSNVDLNTFTLPQYDDRITKPSGTWAETSNSGWQGSAMNTSSSGGTLAFAPAEQFDTIEYWYGSTSGAGSYAINVDGGSSLVTVNCNGSSGYFKGGSALSVALGTHTVNFVQASGQAFVYGCSVYDSSANNVIRLMQFGTAGFGSVDLALSTAFNFGQSGLYPGIGPHCTFLKVGINDWWAAGNQRGTATALATFKSDMQTVINTCLQSGLGDVILVVPTPTAQAVVTGAVQEAYIKALYDLAVSNGIPLLDLGVLYRNYTAGNLGSQDLYSDSEHPSSLGYGLEAEIYAELVRDLIVGIDPRN